MVPRLDQSTRQIAKVKLDPDWAVTSNRLAAALRVCTVRQQVAVRSYDDLAAAISASKPSAK